ncbi:MAG: M20/M25/M40 family metallo-hydrolase [Armatimonadia bacterium]|nr:M20/M25/M40 family metallo-hydrolase [Armatimonadia bacterium]
MEAAKHEYPQRSLDFLFELLATPSISGYEDPGQRVVADYARHLGLEPEADVHGNVWAILGPDDGPLVGLEGHVDQIGMTVKHINDDGFLHVDFVGGSWEVYARRVTVHTKHGPVPGVIGKQPLHYGEAEDRTKTKKIHEYWIDIGARSGSEARQSVALGDPITYDGPPTLLGRDLLMSCGLDNRISVFCAFEALRLLKEEGFQGPARVAALSCVQEEVSMVGATTLAHSLPLDVVIAADVWPFVTDVPDCDARRFGELKLGSGPCIVRGANIAPRVFEGLVDSAKESQIPYQVQAWPGQTPTDAMAFFKSKGGTPVGLLGAPERYLHTPSEVVHMGDLWNMTRLMAAFARSVESSESYSRRSAILG